MPTPQEILEDLKQIKFPGYTRDIVSFGIVRDIEIASAGHHGDAGAGRGAAGGGARRSRRRCASACARQRRRRAGRDRRPGAREAAAGGAGPAQRHPRRAPHHRGGQRQGRRRQVDGRGEPGAGAARARPARRPARRRRVRPERAADARPHDPTADAGGRRSRCRRAHPAARALRPQGHLARAVHPGAPAGDLARADDQQAADPVPARGRVGRRSTCWCSTCRPAPATRSSPSRSRRR